MAQTPTTLSSVLKERWTDNEIQKQWLGDDTLLSRIERETESTMIGRQAQTPIWPDLNSGGYTSTGSGGGSINTATNQPTAQAAWTLVQHFMPISMEFGTINQSRSNLQSVISGKNLEIRGAIATVRNQGTRQVVTNGDGKVAACGTSGGASVTVPLTAAASEGTAYGYSALVRDWLRPGAVIDIGTTADTDALATAATVTAVSESATAPTITTSSVDATAGTHFIYIANPNSTTAANTETNGLRNIVNTTGALGGLNPATAGSEYWAATVRDTSTTVLSLDLILSLSRAVLQKTGNEHTESITGFKQQMNFYSLLQNQVRFPGEMKLGAGNFGGVTWGNTKVDAYPAVLDTDWFCLTLSDIIRVTGDITKPTWYSELAGMNQGMIPTLGSTAFGDQLVFSYQIGARRRKSHAAATGLTA
jgi:hypothetical protein